MLDHSESWDCVRYLYTVLALPHSSVPLDGRTRNLVVGRNNVDIGAAGAPAP